MRPVYKCYILIAILFLNIQFSFAQIESKGTPVFFNLKSSDIKVPEINLIVPETTEDTYDKSRFKSLKIAELYETDIDVINNALWIDHEKGKVGMLSVSIDEAKSIGLIFSKFKLPENTKLFLYNEDGSVVRGSYTSVNNKDFNTFAVNPLPGNKIYIQIQTGNVSNTDLTIGKISYSKKESSHTTFNAVNSEYCNVDINCNQETDIQQIKHAVCKLLIDGVTLCSGTLINNTANDGKAYLITANHCIQSNAEANNTIFYFDYEKPYCDGPFFDASQTISGATLVATYSKLDFSLVELSIVPPYQFNPYYSGWSLDTTTSNTYCIHHPTGDVKKISEDHDSPVLESYSSSFDDNAFWRILEWDSGTTEGGSSGGPLFNNNLNQIGILTGGWADCDYNFDDYFARFDKAWDKYPLPENQLKHWLDPDNSNTRELAGLDPFTEFKLHNFTIRNTIPSNVVKLETGTWGYLAGHNSMHYNIYSEKFHVDSESKIIGAYFNVAKAKKVTSSGKILVYLWNGDTDDNNIIYSKYYPVNYFLENEYNFIQFDSLYTVNNDFHIGYRLFYLASQDTFALYTSPLYNSQSENTAMTHRDDLGWINLTSTDDQPVYASLDIVPVLNNPDHINKIETSISENSAEIYPNPAGNILTVRCNQIVPVSIKIFDINGKALYINDDLSSFGYNNEVDVSELKNGIYLLQIDYANNSDRMKFIIVH